MKLSEAIRLGAMLRPQCRFLLRNAQGDTCAMGAAAEAAGIPFLFGAMFRQWPILQTPTACPSCGSRCRYLAEVIGDHLNDDHRWTREAIADWVETLEPQDPPPEPVPVGEEAACPLTMTVG